jgi:tryptophanyl-tRNA synthetase
MAKQVILSGMQPTGQLHLGNLEGALRHWVKLQNDYEMYCCIVDWHALTSDYDDTSELRSRIIEVAIDYLSAGLDPEKCAIFIQSQVKEHAELHLLFSMIIPIPWLERVPSYKEKSVELGLDSYGFLGYPLLQAADILIYKANWVPVGKDQLPHIELTREVARRFNGLYGDVFPEPQGKLSQAPAILGIDNRKMSKSYDNDICMGESDDSTAKKISTMYTDPTKIRMGDPGHPDECPVYLLHKLYNAEHEAIHRECQSGKLGCVKCKKMCAENTNNALKPIRQRRAELEKDLTYVEKVLKSGAEKARAKAESTMQDVRKAMKMW